MNVRQQLDPARILTGAIVRIDYAGIGGGIANGYCGRVIRPITQPKNYHGVIFEEAILLVEVGTTPMGKKTVFGIRPEGEITIIGNS